MTCRDPVYKHLCDENSILARKGHGRRRGGLVCVSEKDDCGKTLNELKLSSNKKPYFKHAEKDLLDRLSRSVFGNESSSSSSSEEDTQSDKDESSIPSISSIALGAAAGLSLPAFLSSLSDISPDMIMKNPAILELYQKFLEEEVAKNKELRAIIDEISKPASSLLRCMNCKELYEELSYLTQCGHSLCRKCFFVEGMRTSIFKEPEMPKIDKEDCEIYTILKCPICKRQNVKGMKNLNMGANLAESYILTKKIESLKKYSLRAKKSAKRAKKSVKREKKSAKRAKKSAKRAKKSAKRAKKNTKK